MQLKWLAWAKQIQAISQAGLEYSRDVYDLERFEMLRELSVEILREYTDVETSKIRDLFAGETGYATPKVDVRAVVLRDGQVLLVREKLDGAWALPGGWADIGLTPREVAVKEVKEESGWEVETVRLLAVLDKKCHPHPPSPWHVYKLFILCEIVGGEPAAGVETLQVGFFDEDKLPELSVERNTEQQIRRVLAIARDGESSVWLD